MIHDRNSAQADGQRKAFKFTVYVFVFCVVFAAAAGLISSMPKRINSSAAQKLFSNRELTESSADPVVKIPYTVYGRDKEWNWQYKGSLYDTDLISHEGITETVRKARTCIFVWADASQAKKSDTYVWGSGNRKVSDAWFCPVYMTVIDREEGIRYSDIKLGTVPLADRFSGKYSGLLYQTKCSTFNLDGWLKTHLEP